jgi:phytoene dehydrogenase-like protein
MSSASRVGLLVVGGGLAGLAAARVAQARGVDWRLVEGSDRLGGRVATDTVAGFAIDRGFQVLLTAYPSLSAHLDELALGRFTPGAWVRVDQGGKSAFHRAVDPWRRPLDALQLDWRHVLPLRDAMKLARLRGTIHREDAAAQGVSTAEYLENRGFSQTSMDRFFRPFFGGVLLDRDLGAPATFMRRLFGYFSRGDAAIPAHGMGSLPESLARPLEPARIAYESPVSAIAGRRITLGTGEVIEADKVLVCTDPDAAAALTGSTASAPTRWHATTTCYYTVDGDGALPSPLHTPMLVLNAVSPTSSPIHHIAPLSAVSPTLAPAGRHLISVSHDGAADAGSPTHAGDSSPSRPSPTPCRPGPTRSVRTRIAWSLTASI